MKMIKRELFLCITLTAFVFVCALAWGSPFLKMSPTSAAAQVQQTQSSHFNGTVLRNGEQLLLRDSSGQVFRLDGAQSVQSFNGRHVSITGKLDSASKTIHVEHVEPATV